MSDFAGMRVLLAVPCYASFVTQHCLISLYFLKEKALEVGLDFDLHTHAESLITRARNWIVHKFLKDPKKYTHLFFVDADVAFHFDSFFRLLKADHSVVAGIYPMKVFNWPKTDGATIAMPGTMHEFEITTASYPFNLLDKDMTMENGFIEVREAPTGFMCIKRHVLEDLIAAHPELAYHPEENPEITQHAIFDCMIRDMRYLSEDYAFCQRWRDIGGKVYADVNSSFGHMGAYLWKGDLAGSLRARGMLDEPVKTDPNGLGEITI